MHLHDQNGTDVYVITSPHDWSGGGPRMELEFASAGARTLTGLEVRRPRSLYWRIAQRSTHVLADGELRRFRGALAARRKEPILMPAWALGADYADGLAPDLSAPLQIVIDGDAWEVFESGNVPAMEPGPDAKLYPLLWGDFTQDPDPQALSGVVDTVNLDFVEKGGVEYALSWGAALDAPISIGPRDARLWPFAADWSAAVRTGKATVDVFEERFTRQRDTQKTIYPQKTTREYEMGFSLFQSADGDTITQLLSFLQALQGRTHSFWLPTFVDEAEILGIDGAHLTLDDASTLPEYVAVYDRSQLSGHAVTSTVGETVTLSPPPSLSLAEDEATLCALRMARIDSASVSLDFATETCASVELRFVELPDEVDPPAGETYGQTFGGLLYECHLFEYTIDALGQVQQWHYTDHPAALDWNGQTWLPDLIEFKGLEQDDTLDVDTVQVTGRVIDTHPFSLFVPWRLESPLQLTIYRAKLNPDGSLNGVPVALTRGEVSVKRLVGEVVEAELKPHRRLLERRAPSFLVQRECNYALFSAPCGLQRAAWEFEGDLLEYIGGSAVKLRLVSVARVSGVPLPSIPEQYFRGGWIQVGAGAGFQWRHIVECANVEGSLGPSLDVTIAYPFNAVYSVGQAFKLFPGCTGEVAVCRDKFSNFSNFGGCPHVPMSNPTMRETARSAPRTSGGKK